MRMTALLRPPRFDDEEKTRQAFLLNVILWALIIVPIPFLFYSLFFSPQTWGRALAQVLFAEAVNVFLLVLLRGGYIHGAAVIQIAALWVFFSASAWTGAGVHHQAYQIGQALVICIAGFLIGVRGALIMLGVSLLSGVLMVSAADIGWWSFKPPDKAPTIWFVSAILFPVLVVLQYLAGRLLRTALAQSQMSQAQYRNLVEHIPQRIFLKDLNSVYVSCNANYARDLAIQPEQIVGKDDFAFHPKELAEGYRAYDRAVMDSGVPKDIEEKYVVSGQARWIHTIKVPYRDHQGHVVGVLGIFEDITEGKHAKDALRESEARYTLISDNVSESIWLMDLNFKMTWASRSVERNRGYSLDELRSLPLERLLAPASLELVLKTIREELTPERLQQRDLEISKSMDLEFCKKDGSTYWNEVTIKLLRDQEGIPIGILGVGRDIEHRRMREALRESEEKYRLLVESAGEGIVLTQEGKVRYLNPRALEFTAYSQEEIVGKSILDLVHPDDRERLTRLYVSKVAGEDVPLGSSWRITDKNGTVKWVQSRSTLLMWENKPSVLTFLVDITQQREAEEALRASEAKYRDLYEGAPVGYMEYDSQGCITRVNRTELEMLGYGAEEMVGKPAWSFVTEKDEGQELIMAKLAGNKPPSKNLERTYVRKDGTTFPGLIEDAIFKDRNGRIIGIRSTIQDITERKRAEEVLRESEERYRAILGSIAEGYYEVDLTGNLTFFNDSVCELLGYSKNELIGMNNRQYTDAEGGKALYRAFNKVYTTGKPTRGFDWEIIRKDGAKRFVEASLTLMRNEEGNPIGFRGIVRDITDRKRVEEERQRLEMQLLQAQKLEAIGTLAGGIAHDFNNLLMGIQGRASLMLVDVDSSNPHFEHIRGIEEYVRSAADLTKQLLGFARGGKYEVKVTDLNDLTDRSSSLFGRTKKEITIHRKFQPDLWTAEVDRGQIEQVLLNLFVNAWQAMPAGGGIYLETLNVVLDDTYAKLHGMGPGKYVKISVTDTGVGMDEHTKQRIFDPFFTTKGMGRGTGLGLASAYGIIKNHEGVITVYSQKNHGSTFNIYLPASGKGASEEKEPPADLMRGEGTILLVDDEEMIVEVGKPLLEALGYRVITARSGKEAIEVYLANRDEIRMIILDMIMPQMSGAETFDQLKAINPDVKVLLSSGYSVNGQAQEILSRGCKGFIQKPFNLREVSQRVGDILGKL
jgi:two-component system, cell cycle sensor histidine kinase and response regulator CckA